MRKQNTAGKILNIAEQLTRERGLGGWSFQDIADHVNIKKASIYYHFSNKQTLIAAIVKRYRIQLEHELGSDWSLRTGLDNIYRLIQIYRDSATQPARSCLCGILLAHWNLLSKEVHDELNLFFTSHEFWVEEFYKQGIAQQLFPLRKNTRERAQVIISALQGTLLITRVKQTPVVFFDAVVAEIVNLLNG